MNSGQKKIIIIVLIIALLSAAGTILYLILGRTSEKEGLQRHQAESQMGLSASPGPTKNPHADKVRSVFTGKWINKKKAGKRCYAVMINNIGYAFQRQMGTSKADILYEALAEGGITRMMAVYEDVSKVKKIGSVRSARHYYAQFAKEWDAIFCHFGHTKYAVSKMKKLGTDNLSGLSAIGGIVYARDRSIVAPHNVFTNGKKLKNGAKKLKYSWKRNETAMAKHFQFYEKNTPLTNGKKADHITIPFSAYSTCKLKYDADKGKYMKYEYDQKHMDCYYKKQLSFKNVIIQFVKEKNIDHNGYQTMSLNADKGTGYYYTNGKKTAITWSRNEKANKMEYYDTEGNLLFVNPGKTYIAVYPKDRSNLIK